jgi:hypothetical protein
MSNDIKKPDEECSLGISPKRNLQYKSIEEYLFDVRPTHVLDTKSITKTSSDWKDEVVGWTEKDFISFLKCFDVLWKNMEKFASGYLKIEDARDQNDFFRILESCVQSVGGFSYNLSTKTIHTGEPRLRTMLGRVMSINLYQVQELRHKMSPSISRYLDFALKKVSTRASMSKEYDRWLSYASDMYADWAQDEEDGNVNEICQDYAEKLKDNLSFLQELEFKSCPKPKKNRTAFEDGIVKFCDAVLEFDDSCVYPFIDTDQYIDMYDEDYYGDENNTWREAIEQYGAEPIVTEFFHAYYILDWDEGINGDADILEGYVDHINNVEGNGHFGIDLTQPVKVTETEYIIGQNDPTPVFRYYEAFYEFSDLLNSEYAKQ